MLIMKTRDKWKIGGLGINEFGRTCVPTGMRAHGPLQLKDPGFDLLSWESVYKRRRRKQAEGLLVPDRHTWYVASGDMIRLQPVSMRNGRQRARSLTHH